MLGIANVKQPARCDERESPKLKYPLGTTMNITIETIAYSREISLQNIIFVNS